MTVLLGAAPARRSQGGVLERACCDACRPRRTSLGACAAGQRLLCRRVLAAPERAALASVRCACCVLCTCCESRHMSGGCCVAGARGRSGRQPRHRHPSGAPPRRPPLRAAPAHNAGAFAHVAHAGSQREPHEARYAQAAAPAAAQGHISGTRSRRTSRPAARRTGQRPGLGVL